MAHQPVGTGFSFATNQTSASQTFTVQSDTLRVVAKNAGQHVAIGTTGPATTADYFLLSGVPETISIGQPSAQRVVGITTGATTIIDFPEGTGSPFAAGDYVTLSVVGGSGQSDYNFGHKEVQAVNNSAGINGYFSTSIVVANDSSSGNPAALLESSWAELRLSVKVAVKNVSGSGNAYVQQVQVSGGA